MSTSTGYRIAMWPGSHACAWWHTICHFVRTGPLYHGYLASKFSPWKLEVVPAPSSQPITGYAPLWWHWPFFLPVIWQEFTTSFIFFSGVSVVGRKVVPKLQPETKGKPLEEVKQMFLWLPFLWIMLCYGEYITWGRFINTAMAWIKETQPLLSVGCKYTPMF